jgi:hypothetical protein
LSLIAILLLAGIIYFLLFFKSPGSAVPASPANQPAGNNLPAAAMPPAQPATTANPSAPPATKDQINQFNLTKVAAAFAERLGSYSNQSDYSNITDLKIFMTASMQQWADGFAAKAQKNNYSGIYQGVTTRAIAVETQNYSDAAGKADILVRTQKAESSGTMDNVTTYYQDILITFIKENDQWLVDNAKWQAKK